MNLENPSETGEQSRARHREDEAWDAGYGCRARLQSKQGTVTGYGCGAKRAGFGCRVRLQKMQGTVAGNGCGQRREQPEEAEGSWERRELIESEWKPSWRAD